MSSIYLAGEAMAVVLDAFQQEFRRKVDESVASEADEPASTCDCSESCDCEEEAVSVCSCGWCDCPLALDAYTQYDEDDAMRSGASSRGTQTEEEDEGDGAGGPERKKGVAWTIPFPTRESSSRSPNPVARRAPTRARGPAFAVPPARGLPPEGEDPAHAIPYLRPYLNGSIRARPAGAPPLTDENSCDHCWRHHGVRHLRSDHRHGK